MRERCTAQTAVLRAERFTNGKLTAAGGVAARHEGALRAPLETNASFENEKPAVVRGLGTIHRLESLSVLIASFSFLLGFFVVFSA